jgi:hypothetical protein
MRSAVGWDLLNIGTNPNQQDTYQAWILVDTNCLRTSFVSRLQAYAAGYIEGYLQADAIWSVYQNFVYRMLKVRAESSLCTHVFLL